MRNKLPCGCTHDDLYWLVRCGGHAAEDAAVSARWADDRANPPKVKVHRINGVLQNVAFIMQEVETVSPEVMKAMIPLLQEATCQEPKLPEPPIGSNDISVQTVPMNGSDTTVTPPSEPQTDYSALLNLL
jgi:hypothetical protein